MRNENETKPDADTAADAAADTGNQGSSDTHAEGGDKPASDEGTNEA